MITRSDFVWLCPHPPLSVLDRGAIWFPNGEHYGGLNDRHLVASRADVVDCLNVIEDILLHPTQLYESIGQFCLFVLFLFLRRYRRFHGQILGMWLMSAFGVDEKKE